MCAWGDVAYKVQLRRITSREDPDVTQAYCFAFKCTKVTLKASAPHVSHWNMELAQAEGVGGGGSVPTIVEAQLGVVLSNANMALLTPLDLLPQEGSAERISLDAILADATNNMAAGDAAAAPYRAWEPVRTVHQAAATGEQVSMSHNMQSLVNFLEQAQNALRGN